MFFKKQPELRTGEATRVNIGGMRIGFVGLEDALEAVRKMGLTSDAEIGRELVEILRKTNYIAAAAETEYRDYLARHYRVKMGLPVEKPPVTQGALEVRVFGPGCARCKQLFEMVRDVMAAEGIAGDVEYVQDVAEFAAYGVMITPALVINGEVKAAGRIPKRRELADWLKDAAIISG